MAIRRALLYISGTCALQEPGITWRTIHVKNIPQLNQLTKWTKIHQILSDRMQNILAETKTDIHNELLQYRVIYDHVHWCNWNRQRGSFNQINTQWDLYKTRNVNSSTQCDV